MGCRLDRGVSDAVPGLQACPGPGPGGVPAWAAWSSCQGLHAAAGEPTGDHPRLPGFVGKPGARGSGPHPGVAGGPGHPSRGGAYWPHSGSVSCPWPPRAGRGLRSSAAPGRQALPVPTAPGRPPRRATLGAGSWPDVRGCRESAQPPGTAVASPLGRALNYSHGANFEV